MMVLDSELNTELLMQGPGTGELLIFLCKSKFGVTYQKITIYWSVTLSSHQCLNSLFPSGDSIHCSYRLEINLTVHCIYISELII